MICSPSLEAAMAMAASGWRWSMCLKGKRHATRGEKKDSNITHQCIKSMAETELNIDGSKSIKKLILE